MGSPNWIFGKQIKSKNEGNHQILTPEIKINFKKRFLCTQYEIF
jgi:hypothetical protein